MNKAVPKSQLLLWGVIVLLLVVSIAVSVTSIVVDSRDLGVTFHTKMVGPLFTETVLLVLYIHALVRYLQARKTRYPYPENSDSSNNDADPYAPPPNTTLHHYHGLFMVGLTIVFSFVLLGVSFTRLFRFGMAPNDQCRYLYYDTDYLHYDPTGRHAREGLTCSMWVAQLWMGALTSLLIVVDTFLHGCKPVPRRPAVYSSSYEMGAPPQSQYYVTTVYPPGGAPGQGPPPMYTNAPPPPGATYWQPPANPPPPATGYAPPTTPPSATSAAAAASLSPPPPPPQETVDSKRS